MLTPRMECHEMVRIFRFDSLAKSLPYREEISTSLAVATVDPDDIGKAFIPVAEVLPIGVCIGFIENYRSDSPLLINLVAPCRKQSHKYSFLLGFSNYPVDMGEIFLIRPGRIIVNQWTFALCIWGVQSVQFGQDDCLYHRKSLFPSVFEVFLHLCLGEPVEQFPRSIAKIEKGISIFKSKVTAVLGYAKFPMVQVHRRAFPFHFLS